MGVALAVSLVTADTLRLLVAEAFDNHSMRPEWADPMWRSRIISVNDDGPEDEYPKRSDISNDTRLDYAYQIMYVLDNLGKVYMFGLASDFLCRIVDDTSLVARTGSYFF